MYIYIYIYTYLFILINIYLFIVGSCCLCSCCESRHVLIKTQFGLKVYLCCIGSAYEGSYI